MNRRDFIGGLIAITLLRTTTAHAHDISWKIQEDLMQMINSGKYMRYKDTDLVDVLIEYQPRYSAEDWVVISDIGGKREPRSQNTIRAGLPRDKIK